MGAAGAGVGGGVHKAEIRKQRAERPVKRKLGLLPKIATTHSLGGGGGEARTKLVDGSARLQRSGAG